MTKEVKRKTDWDTADLAVQYDERAKKVLGYKTVLAFILSKTVTEFRGKCVKDIMELIEDEVYIGRVPVDPGHTNTVKGERITGLNTEDAETNEGMIRYDILFKVRTSKESKKSYGIIINVEMQKDRPKSYRLSNRAIFYACRLISAQKQREFQHMKFNDMVKVYSIWIVSGMKGNSVNHIHFAQDTLYGRYKWAGVDMVNIVIAGITGEAGETPAETGKKDAEGRELCRMLNTLFASNLNNEERFRMLSDDFGITVDDGLREEVEVMCNLGQGLLEKGEKRGEKRGELRGEKRGEIRGEIRGIKKAKVEDIINFYKVGVNLIMIAQAMDETEEEIKRILTENGVELDH